MKSSKILLFSFLILFLPLNFITASGQEEEESQEITISTSNIENLLSEILADYDPDNLSEEDIISINETFKNLGIIGGPELDEAISALGFDPEVLKNQLPPPPDKNMQGQGQGQRPPPGKNPAEENQEHVKIYEALSQEYGPSDFTLSSAAIEDGKLLQDYMCEEEQEGVEKTIPLSWENVPEGTKSLAIIMYHFPIPEDKTIVNSYILVWGIDPSITEITYGEEPSDNWFMGSNKDGDAISYTSPCSPSPEPHEFNIAIFALADYPEALPMENSIDVDFTTFMDAIESSEILGKAELSFTVINTNPPKEMIDKQ